MRRLGGPAYHLLARFKALTPAQRETIPLVLERKPVFVVAPTATGKTEAAVCPILELRRKERCTGRPTVLYVVPTRALVNDLHRRLGPRLSGYLAVGRRTGEYRELDSDILITTPESFDSMLARGRGGDGTHALKEVRAVILDELHLLAESARGTQLQVLLGRLDAVAREPILRLALSATVRNLRVLADRFLGAGAAIVCLGGGRALRVDRSTGSGPLPERPDNAVDPLAAEFWGDTGGRHATTIPDRLLAIRKTVALKALVFVASRARCDRLAAEIQRQFRGRCPVPVLAHHGSLSQNRREAAESTLSTAAESIAVCTATLELGIDIGDVNLVVLDGPPSSVSSLLQRVGRANRREGTVHLVPFVGSLAHGCILASMIRFAERGELDDTGETAHYSVAIQQLASLFYQSREGRIGSERLLRAFNPVFGANVSLILEELESASWIRRVATGRYGPGDALKELMDNPMALHSNIDGGVGGVPLIDAVTGDPIAWVTPPKSCDRILLAGSSFQLKRTPDAYELRSETPGGQGRSLRYSPRGAPVGRNALRHLCLGLGLPEKALCRVEGRWVHFGGALYSRLLTLAGVTAANPLTCTEDPRRAVDANMERIVERNWERLERLCAFGPFHDDLPPRVRRAAVIESVPICAFRQWLVEKEACPITPEQRLILFPGS